MYEKYPENFHIKDSRLYAWSLYKEYLQNQQDSNIESIVELISNITKQENTQEDKACVYTISLIKLMEFLYDKEKWDKVIKWSSKLDPNYLSNKLYIFKDNNGKRHEIQSKKRKMVCL